MNRIGYIFLLFFLPQLLSAQFYNGLQMVFGKNRVQYSSEKIWSHYRFQNFDTYFYQNGKELAINTAKYAEDVLPQMQSKIEYYLNSKLQFVIFNSMSDMKESNIGLADEDQYNVGGVTRVINNTIILYFDGSYQNFERQIRTGIATVLVNQMLYGQEIGANIKNSALLFLPKWFTEGLISYVADDWSTELDNIARNGFLSGKYRKFNNLTGSDAIIAGHSIWKFMKDKYGEQAIPNVVYLTKITRSLESGFLYYTGMSFKNMTRDWYIYNQQRYRFDVQDRMPLPENNQIKVKIRQEAVLQQAMISPDGKNIAYAIDHQNKKSIYIQNVATGKRKRIFKTGYRLDEEQDFSYPLLAWHPRGELLAFLIEKKGIKHLYYYLPEKNKLERQSVFGVDKIHDMSYAPNGLSLLVSATVNGQSDIFVYHLASKTFERITKDLFDDLNPRFVHGGKFIAFSSNRVSDTIVFDKDTYIRDYAYTPEKSEHYNIFLYNYQSKSPVLWRVTNLDKGNALYPMPWGTEKLQFVSDINGIYNRYIAEIDSAISHVDTIIHYRYFSTVFPVTDYPQSILTHDLSYFGNTMSQIVFEENKYKLYLLPETENENYYELPLPLTSYQGDVLLAEAKKMREKEVQADTVVIRQSYPVSPDDTGKVDINNYVFRGYGKTKEKKDTVIQETKDEKPDTTPTFILPYQRNYDVEYSINQLVSQLDYGFLNSSYQRFAGPGPIFNGPGMNAFFKIGINDLLEDYRIIGGYRLSLNLRNSEFFIGFENYKGRLDKRWLFHRQSYEQFTEVSFIDHKQNNLHYLLQYPFSNVFSFRPSLMLRQDKAHFLSTDYQNLIRKGVDEYWGGAKAELVFDNTRQPQLNILYGQRWKLWGEYLQIISREPMNLIVLGFDYRHYTKIHRNFIFANRIAASTTMGSGRLIYFLGGVDNWLFPRFNYDVNINYERNYEFQAMATNMRGFQQNIRNGNSFFVTNSELRLPVFSYFMNRPLRSEFLNNFQIVGFGDLGTAWEGWNPFSEDNSLFTHVIEANSLTVVVKRYKNPIVGGFGGGLRTKLLGYFIKADLAWGVEDGRVSKPLFYLSLSLDF